MNAGSMGLHIRRASMRLRSTVLVTLLYCSVSLIGFPGSVAAQNGGELFNRIRLATQKEAPRWRLERKRVYPDRLSLRWRMGRSYVHGYLFMAPSALAAGERFELSASELDEKLADRVKRVKVDGLGDDSALWVESANDVGLHFRKGRAHVMVHAPSAEEAERFARIIADQILVGS